MTHTHAPLPGPSRQGNTPTLPNAILMAWESGYAHGIGLVADVLDDVRHTIFPIPQLTHEERVQARIRTFEQAAIQVRQQVQAEQAGAPRRPWGST